MTHFEPYPLSQTPFVPVRRSNTADVVVTSVLIATYIGGFLLIVFFSMFWAMATDSCSYQTCSYDNLSWAYILTDLVGGLVLLSTSIAAIVLMVRKHIAFWVPLLGMATQIILLVISFALLDNVVS